MSRRALTGLLLATCAVGVLAPAAQAAAPKPKPKPKPKAKAKANCTALNRVYPHGVGKATARDKVSGRTKPVMTFTRSDAVYKPNLTSDRDKDGIACEKR